MPDLIFLSAIHLSQVLVLFLCATIFACFVYELAAVKPVWLDVAKGFIPTPEILTNTSMLYTAIGIVGKLALNSFILQCMPCACAAWKEPISAPARI